MNTKQACQDITVIYLAVASCLNYLVQLVKFFQLIIRLALTTEMSKLELTRRDK